MSPSYQYQEFTGKPFGRLMRSLGVCPHVNAGWPIRCSGEAKPSQHCYDCGAQRTYLLQPSMQRGPWTRPQMGFSGPLAITRTPSVSAVATPRDQLAIAYGRC